MSFKPPRRVLSTLLVLLILALPIAARAQGPPALVATDLEPFFDGLIADQMAGAHIPGVTLSVVSDGEMVFAKGYGYADLANEVPVDAETTLFRPGSISKLFTWTALMQLVERRQIDLSADVNAYLDFQIPATFPQPITLYHLMAHTPGFEDASRGLFLRDPADLRPLGEYLRDNIPVRVYPAGKFGAYSNYGSALAGYIVERVSGEPFNDYIKNHILTPLGMAHSTFQQPLPRELAPDMAIGYGLYQGAFVPGAFEVVGAPPAGALSATSVDMVKFMVAHLQDGRYANTRILAEATAQEMHRQHYTPDPRISGMAHGFMEIQVNGHRLIYHGGDTFLFHSGLYLLPEEGVGLFVSYSSGGVPGNTARDDLLNAFMDRYFPASEAPIMHGPADFPQRAGRYVGEYHLARANFSSAEKVVQLVQAIQIRATPEDTLLVNVMGQPRAYVEAAPDVFQNVLNPNDRLLFLSGGGGEVTAAQVEGLAPLTVVKAPFHATLNFTLTLLVGSVLLCLSALVGWPIAFAARRGRLYGDTWLPRLARFVGAAFALVAILTVIQFFGVFGDMDPVYGVPKIFLGPTPASALLVPLSWLLAVLGVGVLALAVLAWLGIGNRGRGYWRLGGQLHYSGLALAVVAVLWLLTFWRLWGGM